MTQPAAADEVVFSTKWFQIATRQLPGSNFPQYVVLCTDFVTVVAITGTGKLLLVRQFRPAIGRNSLELPSGHIEIGETPEEAARKELLEETGHVADKFELLLTVSPAIGRFTNQMWTYFAADARPTDDPGYKSEDGVALEFYGGSVKDLVLEKDFCSSLSHSALMAAIARGKLTV